MIGQIKDEKVGRVVFKSPKTEADWGWPLAAGWRRVQRYYDLLWQDVYDSEEGQRAQNAQKWLISTHFHLTFISFLLDFHSISIGFPLISTDFLLLSSVFKVFCLSRRPGRSWTRLWRSRMRPTTPRSTRSPRTATISHSA